LAFMFCVKIGILENYSFILFSNFVFVAFCLYARVYAREVNLTSSLYINL